MPDVGLPGQLVAVTVTIWNPYVGERLLQGHWSLLVGYGCLPWVARAVIRFVPVPQPGSVWAAIYTIINHVSLPTPKAAASRSP